MKKDEHRVYESLCLHAYLSLTDKCRPLLLHSHFSSLKFTHFIKIKKREKKKKCFVNFFSVMANISTPSN